MSMLSSYFRFSNKKKGFRPLVSTDPPKTVGWLISPTCHTQGKYRPQNFARRVNPSVQKKQRHRTVLLWRVDKNGGLQTRSFLGGLLGSTQAGGPSKEGRLPVWPRGAPQSGSNLVQSPNFAGAQCFCVICAHCNHSGIYFLNLKIFEKLRFFLWNLARSLLTLLRPLNLHATNHFKCDQRWCIFNLRRKWLKKKKFTLKVN